MKKYTFKLVVFIFVCVCHINGAINNKYTNMQSLPLKKEVTRLEKRVQFLEDEIGRLSGTPVKNSGVASPRQTSIDSKYTSMSTLELKRAATKLDIKTKELEDEYERLNPQGNSSGYSSPIVGTPSVSRRPSSDNFSEMNSPSVRADLFPPTPSKAQLETMEIEQLKNAAISMQQQLEELQKASSDSTSTSGHDTTTAISVPSTQDRELNRVFNGNRTMVEAYKAAVKNGNLDGFWSVVKTEIIQKLTECINKIQPGDANADLLIQPTWVSVVHAAKKGEFLSKVAGAINNLDFSDISMPSNSSGPMALHSNYMQKINAALWALIDVIVPGEGNSIVLHGSIDPSRMETNQSPRTKLAFRNVLLSAIR